MANKYSFFADLDNLLFFPKKMSIKMWKIKIVNNQNSFFCDLQKKMN